MIKKNTRKKFVVSFLIIIISACISGSQFILAEMPQQLWENIVCTFNVSPNTIYQIAGYQEDTYGLLKLGKGYKNWRLEVINQKTVIP